MKNLLYFLLLFWTFHSLTFAQNNFKNNIIGSWRVEKVMSKSSNKNISKISNDFIDAVFDISENQTFFFKPKTKSIFFDEMTEALRNAQWRSIDEDQQILIGNQENMFSIMTIKITFSDGQTYFSIAETGLKLVMIKI